MAVKKLYYEMHMNSNKITNLGTPTASGDAVTKSYVDAVIQGLQVKTSCRAATTEELVGTYDTGVFTATANGAISIDGVSPIVGERVLVKNQSTGGIGTQNGIYTVTTVGDAGTPFVLTRATDFDSSVEVTANVFTFVSEGTVNSDSGWTLITNNPITLDTTELTFTQFSGAGQVDAGDGLTKTGNVIAVNVGQGVEISSNAVTVKLDGSTLTKGANGLKVTDDTYTLFAHTGAGGAAHADATTETAGFMSAADKTRLDGLAAYTNEEAQDAVGGILTDSTSIDFTYTDETPSITAALKLDGSTLTIGENGVKVTDAKLKYVELIGNGSDSSIAVTHSLGTTDLVVALYEGTAAIDASVVLTSTSVVTVDFGAYVPAEDAIKIVIIG